MARCLMRCSVRRMIHPENTIQFIATTRLAANYLAFVHLRRLRYDCVLTSPRLLQSPSAVKSVSVRGAPRIRRTDVDANDKRLAIDAQDNGS